MEEHKSMNALGRQIVADFHGCTADLNDPMLVMKVMEQACETAGATIVSRTGHHFSPYGVTAVVVIAESHIAIHTWPEFGYAAVDFFTCGESVNPWVAFEYAKKALGAARVELHEVVRGVLSDEEKRAAAAYESQYSPTVV